MALGDLRDTIPDRLLCRAGSTRIIYLKNGDSLQEAITALSAGGMVYILPGYAWSSAVQIVPKDNVAIICPTRDAVITDTVGTMTTGFFATYTGTTGIDNVTLDGLHFKSTGSANTTAILYADYTPTNWRIEHCVFEDCLYGIQGSPRGGLWDNGFLDSVIRECRFYNCRYGGQPQAFNRVLFDHCYLDGEGAGHQGFVVNGCRDVIIRNCHAYNHVYDGFVIHSWVGLKNRLELHGCHAYDNNRYGFSLYGHTYEMEATPLLVGCRAERNSQHGFYVTGYVGVDGRVIFVACEAMDNSFGTVNGYSGFYLDAACERVELIGCRAYKNNYAQQKYGFEVVAGADKCEIRGGVWYPNQTASWLNGDPSTIINARSD